MNVQPSLLSSICEDDGAKKLYYVRTGDAVLASEHQSGRICLLLTLDEVMAQEMIVHFDALKDNPTISITNAFGAHAIAKQFELDGFNIWTPELESVVAFTPQSA